MSMCHLPARMLDDGCIDQLLRYHLPRRDCLGGALRTPMEPNAALMPVLDLLRAQGANALAPAPTGPIAGDLSRDDAHMSNARGLVA
jgi:integrase/recombinase XerC